MKTPLQAFSERHSKRGSLKLGEEVKVTAYEDGAEGDIECCMIETKSYDLHRYLKDICSYELVDKTHKYYFEGEIKDIGNLLEAIWKR